MMRAKLAPLKRVGFHLLDALLPQTCAGCGAWIGAGVGILCVNCASELARLREIDYCARCGRNSPPVGAWEEGCRGCRSERYWNVAEIVRIGAYEHGLRAMILGLKYGGEERNALALGEMLADCIAARSWAGELHALVPVPMHWIRRLQRPCDHALLITDAAARRLDVAVCRIARRARHGPSQTLMDSRASRFENVRDCFEITRGFLPRRRVLRFLGVKPFDVRDKTVCIVDNLTTSGATIHEISKVLRRAGAKRIYAAVAARAMYAGDPQGVPLDEDARATLDALRV
jgi:predicted amidophosphoribosyltransferase